MICRQCGTEIADKAIVCYRCGAGTTDPVRKAVPIRKPRGRLLPFVALVLLALAALFLGQAGQSTVPAPYRVPAEIVLAVAILAVVVRLVRRR